MPREFIPGLREPDVVASSTFSYFFREAIRRIWNSKKTSFVAVAMIAMSLLILGTFLLAAHPDLARRHYVTREEALARFRAYFTNLNEVVGQLDENPFPPSFECEVTPRTTQSAAFASEMAALRGMAGVEQVQFDWEWIRQLRRLVSLINAVGLIAGGILAVAAAFTIANVIRLTMMLYREEVQIMRLVGATERIIRGPFIVEGILQGTLGGIFAVALLFAGFMAARRFLAPSSAMVWGFLLVGFLPWQKVAALIAGGTLAGWLGSWLSVRDRADEGV
jgi:cell division transport system permease protein